MKPPFKASDSTINVLLAPGFDLCTVWFVGSLSCSRGMTQPIHTHTHIYIREYGSTLYVGMGTEKKWPPIHFNCK